MNIIELNVAKDYSKTPGPRYISEGDFSGEEFRDTLLSNMVGLAISDHKKLVINLDGTAGYATSFLEESFGGLIRVKNFNYDDIIRVLEIISEEDETLIQDIQKYLIEARDEKLRN